MKGVFGIGDQLPVWVWVLAAFVIVIFFGNQLIGVASLIGSMISSTGASLAGQAGIVPTAAVGDVKIQSELMPFCNVTSSCVSQLSQHGISTSEIEAMQISCNNGICMANNAKVTYGKG